MPRSFDLSAEYGADVETVLTAFADEDYWRARLADSGAADVALNSLDVDDDGTISVATTQVLRSEWLPGFVTQLHRGDLRIERMERWSAVADGRSTATIDAAIPGTPVSVNGDGVLRPAGAGPVPGSMMELRVTVEVRVPLIGGKVETFIGGQLVDLLSAEQRFTTAWIGHSE